MVTGSRTPPVPPPEDDRPRMVGWFDPRQLFRTGINVLISKIFGEHADYRLIEALETPDAGHAHDFTKLADGTPRGEIWLDYIADTADGWDSTYSVAYWVSRPTLSLSFKGTNYDTRRGDILVFGGDEVYPAAGPEEYRTRLVAPYRTAMESSAPPHPTVFAIPGNHDWYDSLVSFTRRFIAHDWFAGWKTAQKRSYFAIRLPHDWWLIGTDVQLRSDLDAPQLNFFKGIRKQMSPRAQVILCTAEPLWVYEKMYGRIDPAINENKLDLLVEILGQSVRVFVSGDLHHYRRHQDAQGIQKITAGGGGAFLHATHKPDMEELNDGFKLEASFPHPTTSGRLGLRNLWFIRHNKWFGAAGGAIYLLTAWTVSTGCGRVDCAVLPVLRTAIAAVVRDPVSALWLLALWGGFLVFTDSHFKWFRRIAASLHFVTHMVATLGLVLLALRLVPFEPQDEHPVFRLMLRGVIIFFGGWVVSSVIMGLYLFVSHNVLGRHSNEAFSSLRIPDWKNFLRLHIGKDGKLTIYPVGIRRVPRKWKAQPADVDQPRLVPDDPRATAPELIEAPIRD